MSWSESVVIDGDGSGRTETQARAEDTERSWEELVDDPNWIDESGMGGFNFLDPIGYRYYIAPAMIRSARTSFGENTGFALTIDGNFKEELQSLISPAQAHAIARFLRLMIAIQLALHERGNAYQWVLAYRLHWYKWDRGGTLL